VHGLPFKDEEQQVLAATDEFSIIFCIIALVFMYLYNGYVQTSLNLSMVVIATI